MRRVEVPAYLVRGNLVTMKGGIEVQYAATERWAEPLDQGLSRAVADDLSRNSRIRAYGFSPGAPPADQNYNVWIRLERFEGTDDGQVILRAHWIVSPADSSGADCQPDSRPAAAWLETWRLSGLGSVAQRGNRGDEPANRTRYSVMKVLNDLRVGPTIWRSLLLIYEAIDVRLRFQRGSSQPFIHFLTDTEVSDGVSSFQAFPSLVEELTSGRASVRDDITELEICRTSLTHMGEGMYWPSPTDTREEIDRSAAPGSFESIFVLWPQQNLKDGHFVRTAGWGLGMAASAWSNGATYATVGNTESWRWRVPIVGEVWLHEWLHGACAFFAGQGYMMPDGDADGGARHGYTQSRVSGWTDYYRDFYVRERARCRHVNRNTPRRVAVQARLARSARHLGWASTTRRRRSPEDSSHARVTLDHSPS